MMARNWQGNNYTPQSNRGILSGLLCQIRAKNPVAARVNLGYNQECFSAFASCTGLIFPTSQSDCKECQCNTSVVSVVNLGRRGSLGSRSFNSCHTVFYLHGKNSLLHGWEEHYNFTISQMQHFEDPPCVSGLASYQVSTQVVTVCQDESIGNCAMITCLICTFSQSHHLAEFKIASIWGLNQSTR